MSKDIFVILQDINLIILVKNSTVIGGWMLFSGL
jgi:hypothetical protein